MGDGRREHGMEHETAPTVDPWTDIAGLYSQFAPMVRLAHLLTGSVAIAEDVVQEAFLRVAPKLPQIEHPEAYLRVAVVNGCRSHQRSTERETLRQQRHATEPVYSQPTTEFFDQLKALPDKQRIAVVLRFYADLGDDEIAEHLGCAPATVRVLVFRALRHLRKVVQP